MSKNQASQGSAVNKIPDVNKKNEKNSEIKTLTEGEKGVITKALNEGRLDIIIDKFRNNPEYINLALDGKGNTSLHTAYKLGNKNNMANMIQSLGADTSIKNSDGKTPLDIAKENKSTNIKNSTHLSKPVEKPQKFALHNILDQNHDIRPIISANKNYINVQNSDGYSPLHIAISKNNLNNVKTLVSNGARLDLKTKNGNTPLHHAIRQGNNKIFQYLIEKGADINAQNNVVDTPLHLAAQYNNLYMFKMLVEKRGRLDIQSNQGHTPIHSALKSQDIEISKFAIKENIDFKLEVNSTILHTALKEENKQEIANEIIDKIIKRGNIAIFNTKDSLDNLPLHYALRNNNNKKAAMNLIENGADIKQPDRYGDTPLHFAIKNKDENLFKLLIQRGANVNVSNGKGETPLHLAIENKNMFGLLIKKGAQVNALNKLKESPLHLAVKNNNLDVFKLLVEKGANISAKDNDGNAPIHIAAENGCKEIVRILYQQKANINIENGSKETPIFKAVNALLWDRHSPELEETVKLLLDMRANVKNNGGELLIKAIEKNNLVITKDLLVIGANPNQPDKLGQTPLHYILDDKSIVQRRVDDRVKKIKPILEVLLEKGAKIDLNQLKPDNIIIKHIKAHDPKLFKALTTGKSEEVVSNKPRDFIKAVKKYIKSRKEVKQTPKEEAFTKGLEDKNQELETAVNENVAKTGNERIAKIAQDLEKVLNSNDRKLENATPVQKEELNSKWRVAYEAVKNFIKGLGKTVLNRSTNSRG